VIAPRQMCRKGKAERGNGPKGVSLRSGERELRQGRREDAAW
jgi:hypothetical protein